MKKIWCIALAITISQQTILADDLPEQEKIEEISLKETRQKNNKNEKMQDISPTAKAAMLGGLSAMGFAGTACLAYKINEKDGFSLDVLRSKQWPKSAIGAAWVAGLAYSSCKLAYMAIHSLEKPCEKTSDDENTASNAHAKNKKIKNIAAGIGKSALALSALLPIVTAGLAIMDEIESYPWKILPNNAAWLEKAKFYYDHHAALCSIAATLASWAYISGRLGFGAKDSFQAALEKNKPDDTGEKNDKIKNEVTSEQNK